MRALEIILEKRNGGTHNEAALRFMVEGFVAGEIPSYQMSAWLMAIYFKGMSASETAILTTVMLESGEVLDLSSISGCKTDKHSTGGVGDKVSIILAPLAAAMGIQVPMMSGRGLGHTGGTLDKLESIKGYRVRLAPDEAIAIMKQCGFVMMGQTAAMVPADRLMYALRDASATVESIPLITASILSKKKAEGSDALLLDVKYGSGAFMKQVTDARTLAKSLIKTGHGLGMTVQAILSDMQEPLGTAIGNFLEIEECWYCLQGPGSGATQVWNYHDTAQGTVFGGPSGRLMELTVESAARMAVLSGIVPDIATGKSLALKQLSSGKARELFERNVLLQGGSMDFLRSALGTLRAPYSRVLAADQTGYIQSLDALGFGMCATRLGAGRSQVDDIILPDVGITIQASKGDYVYQGQSICTIFAPTAATLDAACQELREFIVMTQAKPELYSVILEDVII